MNQFRYLLFDLDGTLTDPKPGITGCVAYALDFFGIHVENLDTLTCFIGPPLVDSFMEYYGFSKEQAQTACEKYRERFSSVGLYENHVYNGIIPLLKELKEAGYTLILATSKPHIYAKQILEYFHMESYFSFIAGSELDGTRNQKGSVIAYALKMCNITEHSKVLMIGDRKHDILGAKENQIASLGVLYGYGDLAKHQAAKADYIVKNIQELRDFLI